VASHAITRFKRHSNGAIRYGGCFANLGAHGCKEPRHNSLFWSWGVTVSPDGKSVYVGSSTGITRVKRAANGALAYRGCIANQGHHGCQGGALDSLRWSQDIAVSPDGKSVYVASWVADSLTAFQRASDGTLTYAGCFANAGAFGCEAPIHDSLGDAFGVAVSRDGRSVYVVGARDGNSITLFSRESSVP
jgi:DNA-binding beta-propeller fold protein YncE